MTKIRDQGFINAFGKNIKRLRLEKKYSRERLAAYAEIEVMQIYRIETGKTNTTISTLLALSRALDLPLYQLFQFDK